MTTHKEQFFGFDKAVKNHRLDAFYFMFLEGRLLFSNFAEALKMILTLSHRQPSVEHNFSVSKS